MKCSSDTRVYWWRSPEPSGSAPVGKVPGGMGEKEPGCGEWWADRVRKKVKAVAFLHQLRGSIDPRRD